MQKMLYQILMLLMVPLQFVSGLFLWDVKLFAGPVGLLGGVRSVDTIHVLLFIFFAFFIPVHVYLAHPGAHLERAPEVDVHRLRGRGRDLGAARSPPRVPRLSPRRRYGTRGGDRHGR